MDSVDIHLSVKKPFPLDEFHIMFSDYLRGWIISQSKSADQAGIPLSVIDGYKLYAERQNVPVESIQALVSGDTIDIPASIMLDMGIKISKSRVLVPEERFIIVRDKQEAPRKWYQR